MRWEWWPTFTSDLDTKERFAVGKALRDACLRKAHAVWNASFSPQEGDPIQLQFKDFVKKGDVVTFTLNTAAKAKLLLPSVFGRGKYVGINPGIVDVWQVTRHVTFQGAITRFIAGAFLEKTFVAGGFGFYSATLLYRF
jgi:hypothetical protein